MNCEVTKMGYRRSKVGLVCKDCKDRYLGCHDRCEKFALSKAKEEEWKSKIKEQKATESLWIRSNKKKGEI